tara:strand:- start:1566 stop:1967 length:402 start_codon:yes stop_codon:yes gene_type:complete
VKKSDLKKLIKPLVKECIHEVLLEEGLLSNVVSEVAKGLQTTPVIKEEVKIPTRRTPPPTRDYNDDKKKLMEAIGADAYNGVNLFEGTEPTRDAGGPPSAASAGAVDLGDSRDSGVDISSIMGGASRMWEAMK